MANATTPEYKTALECIQDELLSTPEIANVVHAEVLNQLQSEGIDTPETWEQHLEWSEETPYHRTDYTQRYWPTHTAVLLRMVREAFPSKGS